VCAEFGFGLGESVDVDPFGTTVETDGWKLVEEIKFQIGPCKLQGQYTADECGKNSGLDFKPVDHRFKGAAECSGFGLEGKLDNNGEKLALTHALGTNVFSFSYDTRPPWPITPDGYGFSLVRANIAGTSMKQGEWQDGNLRTLGIWFGKRNDFQGRLLLLVNAGDSEQTFVLPSGLVGEPWIRQFDTAQGTYHTTSLGHARDYRLDASSVALLEC